MGVDTRRPILPAPTESLVDTTGGSTTGTDLATDLSRRTDKTSYSIPDDGSPITVPTRSHRDRDDKLSRSHHDSHTSLLIEYFEGGKGSGGIVSRPSVRVRVTPSGSKRSKDKDRIQITESGSSRKPSYTHRISLSSPKSKQKQLADSNVDDQSDLSNNSLEEGHHSSRPPVEIEYLKRELGSEVSGLSHDARYMAPSSDISSMPADSMLDATSSAGPRRKRSQSAEREASEEDQNLLKTPRRRRSRSLSTERIAHRVAEKLSGSPQEVSTSKKSRSKTKTAGKDYLEAEPTKSSRRRRQAYGEEDTGITSPESSLLSSAVSSNRKSGDQQSIRSGASKSSINNPKLLETVEDAIRRLILPELKELKKDQRVISNTSKFERDISSYSSTSSRDELGRRLSKHASAPDVMKPKVVLNKDSKDEGIVLAGDREPFGNKERKSSKSSDTSDSAWVKWGRPELTEQEKLRRQRSKGLRDAQAAARVGSALTAASLKHHDSQSSLDANERRGSGSQKGANYNETELLFEKHNVPPMPMRSAMDSELTRDSLLSERTESPGPRKRFSQAETTGSPRQVESPTTRTPNRTPLDTRHELDMRHGNQSQRDISLHSTSERDLRAKSQSPGSDWAIAEAAAANLLDAAQPNKRDSIVDHYEAGRTLSPIQSVASDRTETHGAEYQNKHTAETSRHQEPRLSIDSLSSAPSTNLARSIRQDGASPRSQAFSFTQGEDTHELGYEQTPRVSGLFGPDEEESRLSFGANSQMIDESEVDFMDKVKEGQHVAPAVAANPQFVHPEGVESAVASLMDPSILESHQSSNRSQTDLAQRSGSRSPEKPPSEGYRGSPLKQRQDASSPDDTSFPRRMGVTSPPQSVTQSIEDLEEAGLAAAAARGIESPLQEADHSQDSESGFNTNPSIIQGPAGGNRDHWAYDARSPPDGEVPYYHPTVQTGAKDLGPGQKPSLDAEYYETARNIFGGDDDYFPDNQAQQLFGTPPGAKDEGYVSAANPMSPSIGTPKQGARGLVGPDAAFGSPETDDAFGSGHQRHFSGYSHGVGSPLYDSSTGRGIERIKSKDIVALMDHLTVRDAQRNARDTEILVTLVRSAAEMRTSFEEMKKFIAQQDGMLMDSNDKHHERTQRSLGGPRPLPPSGSRSRQLNAEDDEDINSKRQNIFKRALKGLSVKSGNDLSKIEGMLEQLLEEVEALRAGNDIPPPRMSLRTGSVDTNGFETKAPQDNGAVTGPHSPYASSPRGTNGDQRVSTVPEEDEDEDEEIDENDAYMTSHLPMRQSARHERAGSLPLSTPPRKPVPNGPHSTETTPKAADKKQKHKSSSSSIFPKISRWSKSTATSMGDNIRHSMQPARKERPYSHVSRSGSDLALGAYSKRGDYYDPEGDDRIRSNYTLDEDQQENRPPSPLVPSAVSEAPKYRAHRGSLDLKHPQPRQGPTGRYQNALETQAQSYTTPASPNSDQWGSNPSLPPVQNQNRFSAGSRLSPISDAQYSETSSRQPGPPRPPKVKDEGPLVPERPPKVLEDNEETYGDRSVSRGSAIRSPPTRKPTGPRPLTSGGAYSPSNIKRTRYRGSPMQIDYDDDY